MTTLQQLQAPIDAEIANGLIAATPESWNAVTLELELVQSGKIESIKHAISSPEGRKELVQATEELQTASFKLLELFKKHGRVWRKAVYTVSLRKDNSWKYEAKFEY